MQAKLVRRKAKATCRPLHLMFPSSALWARGKGVNSLFLRWEGIHPSSRLYFLLWNGTQLDPVRVGYAHDLFVQDL